MGKFEKQIFTKLAMECRLEGEALVGYIMTQKQKIITEHIENVFPIKEPGERGGDPRRWFTKLTPKDRNHDGKIRANSREELEEKIVCFYLNIRTSERTVRDVLLEAVDINTPTGLRTVQRFDKRLPSLAKLPLSRLDERAIRGALEEVVASNVTSKEFMQVLTALYKVADYCLYEHIAVAPIREIIAQFRAVKLTGKHQFRAVQKQHRNLAFSKAEASAIVNEVLRNPSYKGYAVATMIVTGLRAGELLGLEVKDVHLDDGYIYVHQIEDTKSRQILDYVKENKPREVYLSNEAAVVVAALMEYRESDPDASPFVFLNKNSVDGKLHLRAVDDYMRVYVHRLLGLGRDREARSPHDCRRTYATLEYLNGTDIQTISRQLGHSNIGQTHDYIVDVVDAAERKSRLHGGGLVLDAGCTHFA